jgi:hypothetical protein
MNKKTKQNKNKGKPIRMTANFSKETPKQGGHG